MSTKQGDMAEITKLDVNSIKLRFTKKIGGQYGDGETVPEGETLGAGNYRMICYIATESGLVQSYVYLELK